MPMPRIPIPRRGGKTKDKAPDSKKDDKKPTQPYTGSVRSRDTDKLVMDSDDRRIVEFACTKETKWLQKGAAIQSTVVKPGDEVTVDAWKDEDGFFHAVSVTLRKQVVPAAPEPKARAEAPPPEEAKVEEAPSTVMTPPPPAPDPDDPGRPTLHRGKPSPRQTSSAQVETASASPVSAPSVTSDVSPTVASEPEPRKEDTFLDKVRQTALEFTETLPNYLCKQMTTRYQSEGRPASWTPLDVVSAAVVYEDGKESYRDVRINDKPTKKAFDEIPGSRSRGEFGTTLKDLFSPATAAMFRFRRESMAAGVRAVVYDFVVEQARSHWENHVAGQYVFPAYKGAVWVDKTNYRVLRIEMQARDIPEQFPLDTSEWVVDYEYVRIGPNRYLVPVHAENLACFRGTMRCVRNATDFRNYRRFTGESQIMTVDSTVSFDGEPEQPKPAAKDSKKP